MFREAGERLGSGWLHCTIRDRVLRLKGATNVHPLSQRQGQPPPASQGKADRLTPCSLVGPVDVHYSPSSFFSDDRDAQGHLYHVWVCHEREIILDDRRGDLAEQLAPNCGSSRGSYAKPPAKLSAGQPSMSERRWLMGRIRLGQYDPDPDNPGVIPVGRVLQNAHHVRRTSRRTIGQYSAWTARHKDVGLCLGISPVESKQAVA